MDTNNNNYNHIHNGKMHSHPLLDLHCSSPFHELFNQKENIEDSIKVIEAKKEIMKKGENEETLINLYNALCLQLRYQEAICCINKMLVTNPNSYKLKRFLAIRYLTIMQNDKAEKLFLSLEKETDDMLDITYRLGLCKFYKQNYEESIDYFIKGLKLSKDNNEMYIACLYWYLFALIATKKDINNALKLYKDIDVGHHVGYKYAILLFINNDLNEFELKSKSDDLTRIMFLLGKYYYYIYTLDIKNANIVLNEGINIDKYWASFSGLGFFNIYKSLTKL